MYAAAVAHPSIPPPSPLPPLPGSGERNPRGGGGSRRGGGAKVRGWVGGVAVAMLFGESRFVGELGCCLRVGRRGRMFPRGVPRVVCRAGVRSERDSFGFAKFLTLDCSDGNAEVSSWFDLATNYAKKTRFSLGYQLFKKYFSLTPN